MTLTLVLALYAAITTLALVALGVFHFNNPFPLIQIPDYGHRIFRVLNQERHDLLVKILASAGLYPYGTFKTGEVRQTLLKDGVTVIMQSGPDLKDAISLPVKDPFAQAKMTFAALSSAGCASEIICPDPKLGSKLVVVKTPVGMPDFAYRLPGHKMPRIKWEKRFNK